eukprot:1975430-Rhodomonas_salina.4
MCGSQQQSMRIAFALLRVAVAPYAYDSSSIRAFQYTRIAVAAHAYRNRTTRVLQEQRTCWGSRHAPQSTKPLPRVGPWREMSVPNIEIKCYDSNHMHGVP